MIKIILIFIIFINCKRLITIQNNTPFNFQFHVRQTGEILDPKHWSYKQETINSGSRNTFLEYPKTNHYVDKKKYIFQIQTTIPTK
jgi:hypothetical protein